MNIKPKIFQQEWQLGHQNVANYCFHYQQLVRFEEKWNFSVFSQPT